MIPLTELAVALYQAFPSRDWLSWGWNPPQEVHKTAPLWLGGISFKAA